jgi:hypothetical protein
MRSRSSKLFALIMAFAVTMTACGGGEDTADELTNFRDSEAGDVKPPERVDPKDIALPGLSLATNSPSWEDLLRAPKDRGAVVLFVQPGGPSDRQGIARGDVITHVDGQRVWNDERALALLWSNKGEARKIKLTSRNERERELEIKGEIPRQQPRPFLNVMIENNPGDAVLRYLRAISTPTCNPKKPANNCGTVQHNLNDLKAALDKEPRFVEALTRQGAILFQQSLRAKDKDARTQLAGQAIAAYTNALDIDPRHGQTLTLEAETQLALGKAQIAKSDAEKAVKIDGSLARANHVLARANLALKKPQDAAGPARAALEGNPFNNLLYYRTLAEVFKALKRKEDCSKTLLAIVPWLENAGDDLKKEAAQLEKESKENCG